MLHSELFCIYCGKYNKRWFPSCRGKHSKMVTIEKCNAKTLQHWQRHGDIIMLYDMINTYAWFLCSNWHKVRYSNELLYFLAYIISS